MWRKRHPTQEPPTVDEVKKAWDVLNESAPACDTPEHAAYIRKQDVFEWYYIDFLGKLNPGWNTDKMTGDHDGIITAYEPAWQFSGSKEHPSVVHKEALVSTQSEALAVALCENCCPKWVTGFGKDCKQSDPSTHSHKCKWSNEGGGPKDKWDEKGARAAWHECQQKVRARRLQDQHGYPTNKLLCLAKKMAEESILKTERQKENGDREQKKKEAEAARLAAWLKGEGEDEDVISPLQD